MSIVNSINWYIILFLDTLKQFGRGKIWLPLFLFLGVNWFVLYAHYDFLSPAFYTIITTWSNIIGEGNSAAFTHYPSHFVLLPSLFGFAKLLTGLLFEGLILGGTAIAFRNRYLKDDSDSQVPIRSAASSWIQLVLAWVSLNSIVLVGEMFLPDLLDPIIQDSPRRLAAFQYVAMPLFYVTMYSLFFFAIPSIALNRINFLKGIGQSLRIFVRKPFTVFFLSVVILFPAIIMSFLIGASPEIVEQFRPETIYWLLVVSLLADLMVFFFWMGTAVRFLVAEE